MGIPGPMQIVIILLVIILLFGAKKLPGLARSLGESLGEFRKAKDDLEKQERLAEAERKAEEAAAKTAKKDESESAA